MVGLGGTPAQRPDLHAWLKACEWEQLRRHFSAHLPVHAEDFEARALTTLALQPGAVGARAAVDDLKRVCAAQPTNVLAAANLMQALIDAGEVAEALHLTADAMRQAPQLVPLAEKRALALAAAAQWDEAVKAVAQAIDAARSAGVATSEKIAALQAELEVGWWRPLVMAGTHLRLPTAGDRDFVARCFRTPAFISRYRRIQPDDDAAVNAFVERARHRPRHTHRIDWIVCRSGQPLGLAGLADLDFDQRRGELLVGALVPDARTPVGLQASLAVMRFAFDGLGLRKLTSYVYGDNPEAQANTRHLGLRQEGLLRAHLWTPSGPVDLFVNGMLAEEWRADERLQRLVRRWSRDGGD